MFHTLCEHGATRRIEAVSYPQSVMKKILCILVLCLGLGSFASAQSSYFGVKFGLPYLIGVQYGHDFGASNQGFGVRGFFGSTFVGTSGIIGFGLDALLRTPVGEYGSSAYIGLSGSLVIALGGAQPSPVAPPVSGGSSSNLGALFNLLLGFEFVLGQNWSVCLELLPMSLFVSSSGPVQFLTLPLISMGINVRF